MATAKAKCAVCENETSTFTCGGCLQNFCHTDLDRHLHAISRQFDEIEHECNRFRETLTDRKNHSEKCLLVHVINTWEEETINTIKQTSEQCRQIVYKHINNIMIEMENQLKRLADQLTRIRKENDFHDADLDQCKKKLKKMVEEFDQLLNISIEREATTFIDKITVIVPFEKDLDAKWEQYGHTVAGINSYGNELNQLCIPHAILINDDQTIYIADYRNNRVLQWKFGEPRGRIVAGGNGQGRQLNQLHCPSDMIIDKETNSLIIADWRNRRVIQWSLQHDTTNGQVIISDVDGWGLTRDKDGSLYVSDTEKDEVRRWKRGETNGTIVAGGNGQGNLLNQFSHPTFMFVDEDYSLYVSDHGNHRVMKWMNDAREGIIVAGGNGGGDRLTQMDNPHGLIVDQLGRIYVADRSNHRVMRWCKDMKEGTIVVGGNGKGTQSNQLKGPAGLSFDQQGNLYVADSWNNRIQKFQINKI